MCAAFLFSPCSIATIIVTANFILFIIVFLGRGDDLIDDVYGFAVLLVRLLMRRVLIEFNRSSLILKAIVGIDATNHAAIVITSLLSAKHLFIQALLELEHACLLVSNSLNQDVHVVGDSWLLCVYWRS